MARAGRDPFRLPDAPRNGREAVWWALFEWQRLDAFSNRIGRWAGLVLYLRAVPWVALIVVALWLLGLMLIAGLDLPGRFPDSLKNDWRVAVALGPGQRFLALVGVSWARLAWGLALGLALVLALGLERGLALGLALGLVVGLAGGLADILTDGLGGILQLGLALGLAWGLLAGELAWVRAWKLAGGLLALGLAVGLAVGQDEGLIEGLLVGSGFSAGWTVGWAIGWSRLPFYLFEATAALVRLDLRHNPWLRDSAIRLPFWGARRRLTHEALQDPATGFAFADFLLEYRPLQRGLAAEVLHAATAGRWLLAPLDPAALAAPRLVEDQPRWQPSDGWLAMLAAVRDQLTAARQQSQISLRRAAWQAFVTRLAALRQQTLAEDPRWARFYLPALDRWTAEANGTLATIDQEARRLEPIATNVYRPGTPLRAATDAGLFLGREDLRNTLAREVLTAAELPLLLIQGQRRVGKTSLLNFLQPLLGAGFQVVQQDCQAGAVCSVGAWFADLRRQVQRTLGEPPTDWQAPADWLGAWNALEPWLVAAADRVGRRLILAFDEYETLHRYLAADPDQGARLLAALRSFSQHQTRVCLLFAGALPFHELRGPDWARFFVQAVRLRVDYLDRASALRLITEPVATLRHAEGLPERLYGLTAGHPALLQRLCKELVDIANRDGRRDLTMADLDEALARGIDAGSAPMERFWCEFCAAPACRACCEAILAGADPDRDPDLLPARLRLAEHGYILPAEVGWRLRVPLFEDWLRRYRLAF